MLVGLTNDYSTGLVNGKYYIFVRPDVDNQCLRVCDLNNTTKQRSIRRTNYTGGRSQFAVSLAYALTAYKCQGAKFPGVVVELGEMAARSGMFLTACSRVTSLENLKFTAFHSRL